MLSRYFNRNIIMVVCIYLLTVVVAACTAKANMDKGFALFMVPGISDPRQVDESELADIQLEENPLINEDDILNYNPETHQMELTEEAYSRVISLFSLPVDVNGMPFVVVVADEPIYSGAFYTPASSISYNGVVIIQPLNGKSGTIFLRLGYPCADAFEGTDPRSDSRIIDRLRLVNKLR